MGNIFNHSRRKSRLSVDVWPEDIFRRDRNALKSSFNSSEGGAPVDSNGSSWHASETSCETTRGSLTQTIAVKIQEGWEPGKNVEIDFDFDGSKIRATIPPRSGWLANRDGGPQRYFLLSTFNSSEGGAPANSNESSRHASEASRETARGSQTQTIAVKIQEGWEPGQKVGIDLGSDGRKIRAAIPPQSSWKSRTSRDGGPQHYFLLSINLDSVAPDVGQVRHHPFLDAKCIRGERPQ